MTGPVNLNIPGFDYLFFAVLFFSVVAVFTVALAQIEIAIQRRHQTRTTEGSVLLESHQLEEGLKWVEVQGQNTWGRVRDGRPQQRPPEDTGELIEEAED